MCGGIEFEYEDPATGESFRRKVFFPVPHAQVPVLDESGRISLMQWGRRQGEDEDFDVPQTGWARIQSLAQGKWNRYEPSRVRIPALQWMEKDKQRESHWFDMEADSYLLGVRIQKNAGDTARDFVYVVTRPAPALFETIHHRVPMVVGPAS